MIFIGVFESQHDTTLLCGCDIIVSLCFLKSLKTITLLMRGFFFTQSLSSFKHNVVLYFLSVTNSTQCSQQVHLCAKVCQDSLGRVSVPTSWNICLTTWVAAVKRETPVQAAGRTVPLDNDVCLREVCWVLTEPKKTSEKFDSCGYKKNLCSCLATLHLTIL